MLQYYTVHMHAIYSQIGTKLYCLVTEAHVCEQLAQGHYLPAEWLGVELSSRKPAP